MMAQDATEADVREALAAIPPLHDAAAGDADVEAGNSPISLEDMQRMLVQACAHAVTRFPALEEPVFQVLYSFSSKAPAVVRTSAAFARRCRLARAHCVCAVLAGVPRVLAGAGGGRAAGERGGLCFARRPPPHAAPPALIGRCWSGAWCI